MLMVNLSRVLKSQSRRGCIVIRPQFDDDKGRLRTRLLQVIVKDGGEWKIVAYHNTDVKPDVQVPDPQ
jgi:hypothetical protein